MKAVGPRTVTESSLTKCLYGERLFNELSLAVCAERERLPLFSVSDIELGDGLHYGELNKARGRESSMGGGGNDRERKRESEAVSTECDVIRKRLK